MGWLVDVVTNPFLMTSIGAWFIAQVIKTILHFIIYRKLDFKRMYGDGGMPSGHSATVASLAMMCGLSFGFRSVQFALGMVFAIVVCHDAAGVRRETGKQAVVLNELLESLSTGKDVNLKEWVGHTPFQVFVGVLIGIGVALFTHFVIM
ncbi:MAG: divergent PAP2 family protein [Ruminococcaceae bacterium]|nr:divergent PAP2 family protein [Oscillospiraceae bacterium]